MWLKLGNEAAEGQVQIPKPLPPSPVLRVCSLCMSLIHVDPSQVMGKSVHIVYTASRHAS